MSRVRFLQIFWMMHVGNDTIEESNRAIKRTKKVLGAIEHIEKEVQKCFHYMPWLHQLIEQNSSISASAGN
jgi:hypothetical protein